MTNTAIAEKTWTTVLNQEKNQSYFSQVMNFIQKERAAGKKIYPPQNEIFNALELTPYENVKVVILGQDPYHGPGQAQGLSFSVQPGVRIPPSLNNIYEELHDDLGIKKATTGSLIPWAKQGVLLLNAVLTVEDGKPQSHANIGWQQFTDHVIKSLNAHPQKIVFLLWGSFAQRKSRLIDTHRHSILMAPHPSPLSAHRGFFGCHHFSKANQLLKKMGRTPINWEIE